MFKKGLFNNFTISFQNKFGHEAAGQIGGLDVESAVTAQVDGA